MALLLLWAWFCDMLGQWIVVDARQINTHKGLFARLPFWLLEAFMPSGEQVQTCLLLIPDIWPLPQLTSVRPLRTSHTAGPVTIDVIIWSSPEELLS